MHPRHPSPRLPAQIDRRVGIGPVMQIATRMRKCIGIPQNRNYLLKQKCLHGHKIPKRAEGGAVGSGRGIVIIIVIVLCPICPGTFLNEISGSTRDCSAPALSIEIEFEMVLCWRRSWPRAAKQLQPYGR